MWCACYRCCSQSLVTGLMFAAGRNNEQLMNPHCVYTSHFETNHLYALSKMSCFHKSIEIHKSVKICILFQKYALFLKNVFKRYLLIYGCSRSSLLCGLFSSCSKWEPLSSCAQAAHCGGFSCCGAQGSKGAWASAVAAQQL